MPRLGQSRDRLAGQSEVQELTPQLGILDPQVRFHVIDVLPGVGDAVAQKHDPAHAFQRCTVARHSPTRQATGIVREDHDGACMSQFDSSLSVILVLAPNGSKILHEGSFRFSSRTPSIVMFVR